MKTFLRWLPAILLCTLIFYLSSRQGTVVSEVYVWNYLANKAAHIFLYSLLCISFYRGTKNFVAAVLLTIFYGASDEIHQQFVPTRSGQLSDLAIDSISAISVGLLLWIFYQKIPKKLRSWLES